MREHRIYIKPIKSKRARDTNIYLCWPHWNDKQNARKQKNTGYSHNEKCPTDENNVVLLRKNTVWFNIAVNVIYVFATDLFFKGN